MHLANMFRLRTITYFLPGPHTPEAIGATAKFLEQARAEFESAGYEVQTVRIATDALAHASTPGEALALAIELEQVCKQHGITFVNAGAATNPALLNSSCFANIAAATQYTSCSFLWQQGMGWQEARLLADQIHEVSAATAGSGSFRFGVAFNCTPGIPYFPVAAAGTQAGFAIGTENSGLLYEAFRRAAAAVAADAKQCSCPVAAARRCLADVMTEALAPVEALAQRLAGSSGQQYLGIDASIAPALEPPHITDAYELLGLGRFGGGGTLAISEAITAALKSLPLKLCGYSGLMLPVCEDRGLAEAADQGRLSIRSLLAFSAVCGIGLDTVPVPGVGGDTPQGQAAALIDATAAVLLDVAAMAQRLNKPLSCRLLPVPHGCVGSPTQFTSPYLVNCSIMEL